MTREESDRACKGSDPAERIEADGDDMEGAAELTLTTAEFEECFRRDYPVVARASMLVVGDSDLGREIAQESFTRLYQHLERMRSLDHARRFAFKVALNLARSHLRSNRRIGLFGLSPSTRPHDGAIKHEDADATDRMVIRDALSQLSPRQRACLVLVDYAGFDATSTAQILRIRPSTVHVHLARGRRLLRIELEGTLHGKEDR